MTLASTVPWHYDPHKNVIVRAQNVPTIMMQRNGKMKGAPNLHAIIALVGEWAPDIQHAYLELVGPMPKQGVSSMWSFARGDTALECAVIAAKLSYDRVTPGVWKKAVGAPADKTASILRASQLIPESAARWTPKRMVINKEDASGIAEASLIAYYGAHTFGLTSR